MTSLDTSATRPPAQFPAILDDYVDPSRFPTTALLGKEDLAATVARLMRPSVAAGLAAGLLRPHNSFGGFVGWPATSLDELRDRWLADPYGEVWFAFGWDNGEPDGAPLSREALRYVTNAWRKALGGAPAGADTLTLVGEGYMFPRPVESRDELGLLPMGVFPHGGFKIVSFGGLFIPAGVSCLKAEEDDTYAGLAAGIVGMRLALACQKGGSFEGHTLMSLVELLRRDAAKPTE